jgi:hypothetical protein
MASFPFPPESLNEWRPLDEAGRRSWLTYASQRFFDPGVVFVPSKARGRVIVVDGSLVDTLLGFYCAIGEAVNGPGGYFGLSMLAFDDCLFSGFGLEYPYTIVWRESQRSQRVLDAQALLKYLDDECGHDFDSEWFDRRHSLARKNKKGGSRGRANNVRRHRRHYQKRSTA